MLSCVRIFLLQLEMQKNMFFSNHVFYPKIKVFFIEKNSFLMFFFVFFQLQEDFKLITVLFVFICNLEYA